MPIVDYEAKARLAENRVMTSSEVSERTKHLLRRFQMAYDVSPARRQIFFDKIKRFVEHFPDVEAVLADRDAINEFFAELRQCYSPASYATYISVVRRFLSWVNDGKFPESMCDLNTKKSQRWKRDLEPEDMTTWEEGLSMAEISTSTQLSAICLCQLDCGFRPSEFSDLNFGDVEVRAGFIIFYVRGGKTGGRVVIGKRCMPAILKWLDAHPSKRPEDPLWISEEKISINRADKLKVVRYAYPAMQKRVRETGRRAGIRKPLDFYCLRHSSCTLDKIENVPVELAAGRHGHSVRYFVETYGRLSVDDLVHRFQAHYGIEAEQRKKIYLKEEIQ